MKFQGERKPSRYQVEDIMPEGATEDVDFQKALLRLREQQEVRGAGWLAPSGKFDKGDLAYVREEEEKRLQQLEPASRVPHRL